MLINVVIFMLSLLLAGALLFWKTHFNKQQSSYALLLSLAIFIIAMLISRLWLDYTTITIPISIVSAVLEEISRFFILNIVLLRLKAFKAPYDHLHVAIISGVVFALLENSGYILSAPSVVFSIRFLTILPLHLFLSALHVQGGKKGSLLAILLHALYNLAYSTNILLFHILAQLLAISSVSCLWWWLKRAKKPHFKAF